MRIVHVKIIQLIANTVVASYAEKRHLCTLKVNLLQTYYMDITSIIGNLAAALTTISFLPQAVKTIKTKDTGGLSLPMYLLFVTGVLLWLIYGMMNRQTPIIIGNLITLILAGIIFAQMLKNLARQENR